MTPCISVSICGWLGGGKTYNQSTVDTGNVQVFIALLLWNADVHYEATTGAEYNNWRVSAGSCRLNGS